MSDSQDPLHEYKLQQKENYEERNLTKVGTHHVLQDDVYTALDPTDGLPGSVYSISDYNQRTTGNSLSIFSSLKNKMKHLSDFVLPNYSSLTPAEAASSTAFFGVLFFVLVFFLLSLF